MVVPPELRAQLQQQVIGPGGSTTSRLQRLVNFMLSQNPGLGIQYAVDATSTVEQAYRTRKANCLTFTLLTVALAREAGMRSYGQGVGEVVAWREEDGTIYRFNHVSAEVVIGEAHFTVDFARDTTIARDAPKQITDRQLLALYYNNRAADLMLSASPAVAAPYMTMSLQLDPGYANSWSNAGVLQLYQGDSRAAERDYLKALALDPVNANALFNLVTLYQDNGDEARSTIFEQRLEKVQQKDPYYQFLLALHDEKQGDYALAVTHYKQAIHMYDGDPRFYLGLARAYQQLGDSRRAIRALHRAHTLAQESATDQHSAGLEHSPQ
ncbi:tetratricopeptide repeat protein [Rhodanobacter sp. C03]|uniref:tetratricopeptide repeat protein n=1 Tax=Rhodanobacter sp. C03 TaxID=1945858 RepID=UPI0020C28AEF|nr:tetratricopeptide repeat protein [Rhodanobacter sp. C03]